MSHIFWLWQKWIDQQIPDGGVERLITGGTHKTDEGAIAEQASRDTDKGMVQSDRPLLQIAAGLIAQHQQLIEFIASHLANRNPHSHQPTAIAHQRILRHSPLNLYCACQPQCR
ncbi:hypothetical protein [Synechococcus elongatus]|uniref:hypothetical protein n=1 Tax=Synechococcus elongatus TaxID=32046 RepID=UPI0018649156|nr:hypothetical protein [Synechococcus elongatus]